MKLLFVSYAREDAVWATELEEMLAPVVQEGELQVWIDKKRLEPGFSFDRGIDQAIDGAGAAVLFVSREFLSSKYIYETEFPRIREAMKQRGIQLYWILLSRCLYDGKAWRLNELEAAHDISRPLVSLNSAEKEEVLQQIAEKIRARVPTMLPVPEEKPAPVLSAPSVPAAGVIAGKAVAHNPLAAVLDQITEDQQERMQDYLPWIPRLFAIATTIFLGGVGFAITKQQLFSAMSGTGGATFLFLVAIVLRQQTIVARETIIQARFLQAEIVDPGAGLSGDVAQRVRNFIQQQIRSANLT